MLKLVESDEFAIHSFLSSIKSQRNHTVPILEEIALDMETIIAMPHEQVLPFVADSVFETKGDGLARQFLEGVQFIHEQYVAHLDLKPDNIVVTATTRPHRLFIIDFSVSVRVSQQDSWIKGYRGTKRWAAPELEENSDAEYQPIRADLWSAGRVLQYFAQRQRANTNYQFKPLADRLLNGDPQQRPLLSEIRLDCKYPQMLKPKRKLGVGAQERAEGKRKCATLLSGRPQGILDSPASFRSTSVIV
jgi:serine/threonine protein kinase